MIKFFHKKYRALFCALLLILCVLLSRPFVEMGMSDDWSYIWSAKVLAQTGHIAYFGWAAPILGWQLVLGSLFIRIFGFSFSTARFSMLLVAAATAFLLQRTFVRAGLIEFNATIATLCLVVSPLYLPLAFSFMTDMGGLFSILLCLYICLRAIQAHSDRSAFAWLIFAVVSNTIAGTVRQTAWLGILVLVPSAYFIMRRRKLPKALSAAIWSAGVACVFACIHWFKLQPFTSQEGLLDFYPDRIALKHCVISFAHAILGLTFFLMAILLAYLGKLSAQNKRMISIFCGIMTILALIIVFTFHHASDANWLVPFTGNYVTARGLLSYSAILGNRPLVVTPGVRAALTLFSLAATLSFVLFVFSNPKVCWKKTSNRDRVLPWSTLTMLLLPFSLAYSALLIPRAAENSLYDRYLLPLLVVALVFLVRFYQERVTIRLPMTSIACIVIFALFGIAGMHDLFAMDRARLRATKELHAAGIPDTSFYGGFDYDGWTQIAYGGYINSHLIIKPVHAHHEPSLFIKTRPCGYSWAPLFPIINPKYALSFNSTSCSGLSSLPPVSYKTWLPPFRGTIYIDVVANSH